MKFSCNQNLKLLLRFCFIPHRREFPRPPLRVQLYGPQISQSQRIRQSRTFAKSSSEMDGTTPNRLKLVLMGGQGTGKTALARRFCKNEFSETGGDFPEKGAYRASRASAITANELMRLLQLLEALLESSSR